MDTTSLSQLRAETAVTILPDGLVVVAAPSWVIPGEDRLSYTTIIRLVECCREHHWNQDVLSYAGNHNIDSITKSVTCEFTKPIDVGASISIVYRIMDIRTRGYSLQFTISYAHSGEIAALVDMVCVFFDPSRREVQAPPDSVRKALVARIYRPEIG